MIDWITAYLPLRDASDTKALRNICGRVAHYAQSGELRYEHSVWRAVEGSYAATIAIRADSQGAWVSGNPVKFLTGQNLDGPSDAAALLLATCNRLAEALPAIHLLNLDAARLTRIDLTQSLNLGAVERVREVLRIAGIGASAMRRGRASTSQQTVYLGQFSRRSSMKLYCKADEMLAHPALGVPATISAAMDHAAAGLLRIEQTLRSLKLADDKMQSPASWDEGAVKQAWVEGWEKVTIPSSARLTDTALLALPRNLRRTVLLWSQGYNCVEEMSNGTRYRQRSAILAATDGAIDIFVLQPPVATPDEAPIPDVGLWLREAPIWRASGELESWIAEKVA